MDNIEFRLMTDSDKVQVRKLLDESFVRDAPLCRSQNLESPLETDAVINRILDGVKGNDLSVIAIDKTQDKVIGCRLSVRRYRDDHSGVTFPAGTSDKTRAVLAFISRLYDGINIFQRYNVDSYVHFKALNVRKEYGGRGVARRLVEEAVSVGCKEGFSLFVAEVTGIYSSRLYDKMGYDVLKELRYDENVDEKGDRIFKDTGVHESAKLMAKQYL